MKMTKNKMIQFTLILFSLLSIALIGCGGGGDGESSSTPTPTPVLTVLPADFDFGIITDGNTVDPLEVTIKNSGTATLSVSDIALSGADKDNYVLDLNGGTKPCTPALPTINSGAKCTVTVEFSPTNPALTDTYAADLVIQSNDPAAPTYNMGLLGTIAEISAIDLTINQIEAPCPRVATDPITAYVSVTDQAGFPVKTLVADDFTITEGAAVIAATTIVPVDATDTLSVALLMDYSFSIVKEPDNVSDMENATISFVDQLGVNDEAEIIKYASQVEVAQTFTSDKQALRDAIRTRYNCRVQHHEIIRCDCPSGY